MDKGVYNAITGEEKDDDFEEKNRRVYAELVQALDERSLQLIMKDSPDDGRPGFNILKQHYASTQKPGVLMLYEELTALHMAAEDDITHYIIRAERAATGLRIAGEILQII